MARNFVGASGDQILLVAFSGSESSNAHLNVSAWIQTSAAAGAIFCSDNNINRAIQFKTLANKINFVLFSGATAHALSGATTVTDGKWHHVAGTYDGTTMRVYVDGTQDGTLTASNNGNLQGRTAAIGAQIAGVTQGRFTGSIAEVSVINDGTTPSANQIAGEAHGGLASHLGLGPSHYWPLWGDSPEEDIGIGLRLNSSSISGTTVVAGPPTSPYVMALP